MHAIFWLSGVRYYCDELLGWLDHRYWDMPFKNPNLLPIAKDKDGNIMKEGVIKTTARVRYGVYGTYEICFPEEYKDVILTTLRFHQRDFYRSDEFKGKIKNALGKAEIAALRKLIGCEPIPKFNTDQAIPLPEDVLQSVRIIPIGVRYDTKEWEAPSGLVHERI